uniref:Dna/rna non-specific endonuclease protein (EC) n=1 Tax=Ganoderma boninense TaxID=34458 RepID=A0A5K1K169_9APHY|nr:Putative dna/rna non-specific endonuclease protein (EC [Ganoderma boninense]
MRLPIEVCEAIIDDASDDPQSLHQLCLTCAAFVPRARHHLFTSIVIRTSKQMESYLDFVHKHPWIPARVQKVTLSASIPKDNDKPNIRPLEVIPVHIFVTLPNLQTWSMEVQSSGHLPLKTPSLSLHRSVLRWYRKCGNRIRTLELDQISFEDISDFTGLVSALTNIQSLRCSRISFRTKRESNPALLKPGTLQVSNLEVSTSVDIGALEYMLARSTATLRSVRFSIIYYYPEYFERLEKTISWPKQLTSLVLVVNVGAEPVMDNSNKSLYQFLRGSTGVLERVEKSHLRSVRVEFNSDPISRLGSCLSHAGTSLEACKVLEGTLLRFTNPRILVSDVVGVQRAGRADFWSSVIRRAFPTLSERGLLTINSTHIVPLHPPDLLGHESATGYAQLPQRRPRGAIVLAVRHLAWIFCYGCSVWEPLVGGLPKKLPSHPDRDGVAVNAFSFDPESRRVATAHGNADRSGLGVDNLDACVVRIWDVATGAALAVLTGHWKRVTSVAFSPDGRSLLTASDDKSAASEVAQTVFSPDAKYGATGSSWEGQAFALWRTEDGSCAAEFDEHTRAQGRVTHIAFSPNGEFLASGDNDGVVHIRSLSKITTGGH